MTAEERIGNARRGRALLRASDSDRDRVLDILKTAFVQGRLSEEELDQRVGQTLDSRTWGDLTAVTADIPAWPLPQPVHTPARTSSSRPVHAVVRAISCAIIALAAIAILGLPVKWTMPARSTGIAQACQAFDAWRTPYPHGISELNFALMNARTGADPNLSTHLVTLQQAWRRSEALAGHPQSVAFSQAGSQLNTAINVVASDCANDGGW